MRFRNVHLDFHTSELVPDVGQEFDRDAFAKAYQEARVNCVNLFAKCHHGLSYHPTSVGIMHPHLGFDLLGNQIDALQSVGIKTPIYMSANWDEHAARSHPEWRVLSPEGDLPRHSAHPNGAGWAFLDFASDYLDYFCAQIAEVALNYSRGDGFWIDIAWQPISVSEASRKGMYKLGLDWTNAEDQRKFNSITVNRFFERVHDTVKQYDSNCPLFFNSGHIRQGLQKHYKEFYSHLEIESLPTGGWGYDDFPLSARYVETTGQAYLGMTGKFHTHWGEFGGYKTVDALRYECANMLAHGARCCIGDHLHPNGKIDAASIKMIQTAFEWVEAREPWIDNSTSIADIAVLSNEATLPTEVGPQPEGNHPSDIGAVRVLLEGHFLFDVVDSETELSPYKLLILPDDVVVSDQIRHKVDKYVEGGGRVLLTGKSGIVKEKFVWDVGADWIATSTMTGGDYALPIPSLRPHSIDNPLFLYLPTEQISLRDGQGLGDTYYPYFDRTAKHFCGHLNAPNEPEPSGYAIGTAKGSFVYFAAPIFLIYSQFGAVSHKEVAQNLIYFALKKPKTITTDLPFAARVTMRRQYNKDRDIVHLLYATPAPVGAFRGKQVLPIQDLVTLYDIPVSVLAEREVISVMIIPDSIAIEFAINNGRIEFVVPQLHCHTMIEITYAPIVPT